MEVTSELYHHMTILRIFHQYNHTVVKLNSLADKLLQSNSEICIFSEIYEQLGLLGRYWVELFEDPFTQKLRFQ